MDLNSFKICKVLYTPDGQEIIKIKGLSHDVLPSFSELKMFFKN